MHKNTKADDIVRLLVAVCSEFNLAKCQSKTDTLTHTHRPTTSGHKVSVNIFAIRVCALCSQTTESGRPDLALFLVKYVMTLVVGISGVFWVSSKKTCSQWAFFFNRTRKRE